ncbi:MAG: ATP-binding protein [Microscillaceae bacterium]|jgi:hypothetical protein|nr:ATP-binding protein [Microscillaceae bacterium]
MIVEFTVGNFLSFKENRTFSMVGATAVKEFEDDYSADFKNVFYSPNQTKLLKSSVFYGANGSGKSNLLAAFRFFRNFILKSYDSEPDGDIDIIKFALSTESDKKPAFFEMIFFVDNIRYRYGFEVDNEQVCSEWLFSLTSSKESTLFVREFQEFDKVSKEFKNTVKTRKNSLFLSKLAQDDVETALKLRSWFKNNLIVISGLKDDVTGFTIGKFLHEPKFKNQLIEFFKVIKIGSQSIDIIPKDKLENQERFLEKLIAEKFPKDLTNEIKDVLNALQKVREKIQSIEKGKREEKQVVIEFSHNKFDDNNNFLEYAILDLGLQSKGTQKIFNLFGLWIDAIEKGKVLIIDELDASLHTLLTQELIKIFHSKTNKNGQLIFASHDTNLLKKEIFRRDQIWFAEKDDKSGATDLYSLVEYKDVFVRNDASFEKGYLEGKYGAVPYLGDIQDFLNDFIYEQKQEQQEVAV